MQPSQSPPRRAWLVKKVEEAKAVGGYEQRGCCWEGPPARGRVSGVQGRGDIVQSSRQPTPVEQIIEATKDAVLWDKWGMGFPTEQGVDSSMVIQVKV